jgi:hypothetical protein
MGILGLGLWAGCRCAGRITARRVMGPGVSRLIRRRRDVRWGTQVDEGTAVFKAAERGAALPPGGGGGGGGDGGFIGLDADGLQLPSDWWA